jgi:hypothetical protein
VGRELHPAFGAEAGFIKVLVTATFAIHFIRESRLDKGGPQWRVLGAASICGFWGESISHEPRREH